MESIDANAVSQVVYNPECDTYDVYVFGQKVESFIDEVVAAQLSFHLVNMYQRGRLDVAQNIHYGFVTPQEILLTESGMTEEDFAEDF